MPDQDTAWASVTQTPRWASILPPSTYLVRWPRCTWNQEHIPVCVIFLEIPETANAPSGWRQQEGPFFWPWTVPLMLIFGKGSVPISLSTGVSARWSHSLHTCLLDPGVQGGSRQSQWNLITSFPTTSHLDSVTFLFCLLESTRHLKGWCRIPSFQRSKHLSCRGFSAHFLCALHGKRQFVLHVRGALNTVTDGKQSKKSEWYMVLQSSALGPGGLFSGIHSFTHQIILERHCDILSCFVPRPRHALCRLGAQWLWGDRWIWAEENRWTWEGWGETSREWLPGHSVTDSFIHEADLLAACCCSLTQPCPTLLWPHGL